MHCIVIKHLEFEVTVHFKCRYHTDTGNHFYNVCDFLDPITSKINSFIQEIACIHEIYMQVPGIQKGDTVYFVPGKKNAANFDFTKFMA